MTLDLIYDGYEQYIFNKQVRVFEAPNMLTRERAEYIFKFPNNYGCIVEKHTFSKGYSLDRWELSPIIFDPNNNGDDYHFVNALLTKDEKLTSNDLARTRGSLTDEQVCKYLEKYKNL